MPAPRRVRRPCGVAVALASGAAISLAALSTGIVPALAAPVTDTLVPTTTEAVPTTVPQATATVETPPQTQATVPPALTPEIVTTQAPVVTQAPEIVTTTAATPIPTPSAAVTTTAATPIPTPSAAVATTTTGGPTSTSVRAGLAPSGTSSSAQTGPTTTQGATSTSSGAAITTSGSERMPPAVTTSGAGSVTPSIAQTAAEATPKEEPKRLAAPPQDVELAKTAPPVEQNPVPAPQNEIDRIKNTLSIPPNAGATAPPTLIANGGGGTEPARRVLQWQPEWVQYDEYFRPLIFNPYREPLQLVYLYGGEPRIMLIPPMGRIVTEARDLGSYNFTAMRLNAFGIPIDLAVGNFFGGGFFPGPGLPPPPPPPPVVTSSNVPVVVKYQKAEYQPFRVQRVVDVGPDPSVGEHKVLLDGVTPAWGEWKQTETGERQFEVHKTQSFPGMEQPQEGPLPGDYPMQLVSDSAPSGLSTKDVVLIGAAVVVALLGVGAIVLTIVLGRRRPQH